MIVILEGVVVLKTTDFGNFFSLGCCGGLERFNLGKFDFGIVWSF